MKILSVVGARPQFIKAAVLSAALERAGIVERLVHTGQHYDYQMSQVFFDELGIRAPDYSLDVGSGSHGSQTADMLKRLEPIIIDEAPDYVLVYGDTNSTLAGALAAAKLVVPVVHVEAGLRSFDRSMPEEINRIVADHLASVLFAPSEHAAKQLRSEGIAARIEVAGDLMVDLAVRTAAALAPVPEIVQRFGVATGSFALATVHRAGNTDDTAAFAGILAGLRGVGMPVIFPVHPRTTALANAHGAGKGDNIIRCEPLSYVEMIALIASCATVLTDSGGVQKEAYVLGKRCVTLREQTEWVETLAEGWNALAGADPRRIIELAARPLPATAPQPHFGDGASAQKMTATLLSLRAPDAQPLSEIAR